VDTLKVTRSRSQQNLVSQQGLSQGSLDDHVEQEPAETSWSAGVEPGVVRWSLGAGASRTRSTSQGRAGVVEHCVEFYVELLRISSYSNKAAGGVVDGWLYLTAKATSLTLLSRSLKLLNNFGN
jgi:hypothetical protein